MKELWFKDSGTRAIGPLSKADDQSYGMVIPVAWVEFNEDQSEQASVSNLIASAPDLLNALQFVLPWLPTIDSEALFVAEQAIKKALGK